MSKPYPLSVVIPTYQREEILLTTISHFVNLRKTSSEIVVVDQTLVHKKTTEQRLNQMERDGLIRLIRLTQASVPHAMNVGLCEASSPIVLFVDDDIIPAPGLIEAHVAAYEESKDIWAIVGQVLQPGEGPVLDSFSGRDGGLFAHLDFKFCSMSRNWIRNVIACNLSVHREKALEIGGFDENFVGVAYRFETEFCRRIWNNGGKVIFEPSASIRHLREATGGTRRYGNHLRSPSPAHGVGDYYFAMRSGINSESILYMLQRPFRETCTKFHLRNPWYIPVKWIGELGAFFWAVALALRGPKYISN